MTKIKKNVKNVFYVYDHNRINVRRERRRDRRTDWRTDTRPLLYAFRYLHVRQIQNSRSCAGKMNSIKYKERMQQSGIRLVYVFVSYIYVIEVSKPYYFGH